MRRWWLALALVVVACSPAARPDATAETPCWLDGLEVEARCRTLDVPSRLPGDARTIPLFVARLPAEQRDPGAAPVVFLAGGPGQAASSVAGPVSRALARVRRRHDLIFVDVRGTGRSGASPCEPFGPDADEVATVFDVHLPEAGVRRCRDALPLPPAAYGTIAASDDLDDVRKALGVERIALYGVSYGSRLALVHLARHGAHVASVAIDGVLAPETPIFATFDADAQAALDELASACRRDPACGRMVDGDLVGATASLLASLDPPRQARIAHPRTGKPLTLTLHRAGVAMALRGLLYDPALAATLPMVVHRAAAGDWAPLVTAASLLLDATGGASFAQLANVTCLEDLPRIAAESAGTGRGFVGDAIVAQMRAVCAIWTGPAGRVPASAALPSSADAAPAVPLLLLSGSLDPVTPARHADAVRRARGGRAVVIDNAGHWAGRSGCGPAILAAFFDDPAGDLPERCGRAVARPAFAIEPSAVTATTTPVREVVP